MNRREKDITMLYIATLGRMPDKAGFNYWVNSELTVSQIADSFFDQPEAKKLYPPGYSTDAFIKAVYNNLFDRDPDENGLRYWHNELESGHISRKMFILSVIYGADDDDAKILENKINSPFKDMPTDLKEGMDYHKDPDTVYTQNGFNGTFADNTVDISEYKKNITKVSKINNGLDLDALYSKSEDAEALLQGVSWNKSIITYSFNTYIPKEYFNYSLKYTDGWRPFTEHEKELVRGIFEDIEKFTNLTFVEVSKEGDIRFNHVDMDDSTDGFATLPYPTKLGGDIWISNFQPEEGDEPGTGRYYTFLHEIGHALGLKHSFAGSPILPPSKDDSNHTVMTYTYKGDEILELNHDKSDTLHDYAYYRYALPNSYEVYDIEALQSLYGPRLSGVNDGNTVYNLSNLYNKKDHMVIWDTSGKDLIDLSHTDHSNYIDLRGGRYSSVDVHFLDEQMQDAIDHFVSKGYPIESASAWAEQVFINSPSRDRIFTGENILGIVKGSVIENIVTGSANDVVIDNEYNNIINLGDGNDKIFIRGGAFDQIDGGNGRDKVYFQFPSYRADIKELSDGKYIVDASKYYDTFTILENVEIIGFTNMDMELV